MAHVLSTGLWDALGSIQRKDVVEYPVVALEEDFAHCQSLCDTQFQHHPHGFDWDRFNETGRAMSERMRAKLPLDTASYYESSDDRELFSPQECCRWYTPHRRSNELALRERKRTLIHLGMQPSHRK